MGRIGFHGRRAQLTRVAAVAAVASVALLVLWPQPSWAQPSGASGGAAATVSVNGPAVTMKVTTPGKAAKSSFTGKAGQRISTVVTNLVTSDNPGCATLTLLNPSGGVVDTSGQVCDVTSTGLANAPDVLTVSGTYTVRLELDQTATGSAKLWVSAPVTAGTVSVNGPAAPVNVTRVGQGVQRTFAGKAGQRISTVVTNLVTSDNPGCATLTLLNPSGGVVDTSGQVCDVTSTGLANAPDVLTVSGTYTVRLELDQTATGSAKLWVSAPVTAGTVSVNGPGRRR